MAANVDSGTLHKQADNVWKMLDDMADSDPEAYKTFMDKILKEGPIACKPPEPCFCVSTVLLPEVVTHKLFINICSWVQVPEPKTDKDPGIPVTAGEVQEATVDDVTYSSVDVFFNPSVLKGVENKKDHRNLLIHLALDYLEDTKRDIRVSRKYKNLKIKYKGDTNTLRRFLRHQGGKSPFAQSSSTKPEGVQTNSPESLMHQLSSITSTETETESPSINLFNTQQNTFLKPKKGLIHEISSSCVHSTPIAPRHKVIIREADAQHPRRVIVRVDLPDVKSTRECELDVSEVDISVQVPNRYKLHVKLPVKVDDDRTSASFNTTNHRLIIKLPVK